MLDVLAFYIPEDRRQAIARGDSLPRIMHGAALYVDISGFTQLTETLVQHHGPQKGAEELTVHLERVYTALIQQLHQYQGSVIGYSGDAMTCWFSDDNGCRAVASAFGIQSAMKQLAAISLPTGVTVPLAVKVAVVVGEAQRMLVGDPSIQLMDLLGGSVTERLAAAADVVDSGEVVVDADTANKLRDMLTVGGERPALNGEEAFAVVSGMKSQVTPVPWPEIPTDLLTEETLCPWVLPALYERIRRGYGQYLTELRPTVALFLRCDWIDFANNPSAGDQLDAYVRWVQAVLTRYEGILLEVILGEKGSFLYGTFGAPVVHEDDARRAVSAALELQTPPADLAFVKPVPIGLSRGTMRTGPAGSALRRTYGVLGDEVNVAARLMQAAKPGEIFATERVAQRVTGLFDMTALSPLKVKGKSQPVPVFHITGVASKPFEFRLPQNVRLVGRVAERARLNETTRSLMDGQSNILFVEGDAGIGKSRLLEAWLSDVPADAVRIYTGSGDSIERSTPYHAWKQIFNSLFQLDALTDDAARREVVLGQLQAMGLDARAPLLNVILPLDIPENDLTLEMTGKVRADNTHEVLVALLQKAASEKPLLIAIEDAQWLDSASLAFALAVSRQVEPLLLSLVARPMPGDVPADYRALLEHPDTIRLQLDTLQLAEAIQLACDRLGVESLPGPVVALIQGKAEGHPFFSEELAYALRDSGVLKIVDGQAQIAPGVDLTALNLPDTVEGVVTSRIDLLTPGQQQTIKVASVIGRVFGYRVLEQVHTVRTDIPKLMEYLDHMKSLDVTPLAEPPPNLSYMFKHIITQEAAYNLLLFTQRSQLHQAVAEWYERTFAEELVPFYPLLAHHWLSATETAQSDLATRKAVEYLEKAGTAALHSYANREVVGYFSKLLTIVTPQSMAFFGISILQIARWEQQLGEAHNRLGNLADCEEHFGKSLTYLGWPLPNSGGRLALDLIREIARQTRTRLKKDPGQGIRSLTDVELETRRLACIIYERLGLLYFIQSNTGMMIYCPLASLNLAEEVGPSSELSIAYSYLTSAAGLIPVHGLARLYERLTLNTAEQVNNPLITARVLMAASVYSSGTGRLKETAERLQRAITSFEQGGVWEWWGVSMEMLTRVKYYQGEFKQSADLADRLYTTAKQQNNTVHQSWSLTSRMENHLLLADRGDILTLASELEDLVQQTNESGPQQKYYGVSALVHMQNGDWEKADEFAKKLLEIISVERPTSFGLLTGYMATAETYLGLWERKALSDMDYVKKQAALACKLLTQFTQILPLGEPAKLRAHGLLAWRSGKPDRARKLWTQGLARAQELDMPLEEALANYELGRHLADGDPQRQIHLERAKELFEQMGVGYYNQRMQEALQGIQIT